MTLTTKLIVWGIALLGLFLGGLWLHQHIYDQGYAAGVAKTAAADARALAVQQKQEAIAAEAYQKQLQDADHVHQNDIAYIATLRATPVAHVVCRAAPAPNPSAVPRVPSGSADHAAGSGRDPQSDQLSFDPTDALYAAADSADDAIESCRNALAKWPKPTGDHP